MYFNNSLWSVIELNELSECQDVPTMYNTHIPPTRTYPHTHIPTNSHTHTCLHTHIPTHTHTPHTHTPKHTHAHTHTGVTFHQNIRLHPHDQLEYFAYYHMKSATVAAMLTTCFHHSRVIIMDSSVLIREISPNR